MVVGVQVMMLWGVGGGYEVQQCELNVNGFEYGKCYEEGG